VVEGTGKKADIPGLFVAGKTGTAQIAEKGKYKVNRHVASFVGYWPYRAPELLLLVIVGEPQNVRDEGGAIAAPLFREMAEAIAQLGPVKPRGAFLPSGSRLALSSGVPEGTSSAFEVLDEAF